MFACVLRIQGENLCSQPAVSPFSGSMLLWNGEFLNREKSGESDTREILDILDSSSDLSEALGSIEGPFAFVYFDKPGNRLWFGKDKVGRRSMLVQMSREEDELVIASCGLDFGTEVPAGDGVFSVCLSGTPEILFHEWKKSSPFNEPKFLAGSACASLESLHDSLKSGLQRHIESIVVAGPVGILFSGGVDSMIVACIVAELYHHVPHKLTGIDLVNVATCGSECPDRCTGLVSFASLMQRYPTIPFRFICTNISQDELKSVQCQILNLSAPNNTHMDFNISSALWFGARARGYKLDPSFCQDPEWPILREQIIAAESLSNAAENRRPKKDLVRFDYDGPCKGCGKRKAKPGCHQSSCKICCKDHECVAHNRSINSNITKSAANITALVARYMNTSDIVQSSCRLLLVGHGADELFGGYGRHETRANRVGLEALREEMLLDLRRLWTRNLGRDDRVMANHGRDIRHPFLDEPVIDFVKNLNVSDMFDPLENKPLLRRLAREVLGMNDSASFRKRAIQFGTRLAQNTNVSVHGSHSKGSGKEIYSTVAS
jgi:asparagine synthetase B (glutamine-hydrolysing)